MKKVLIIESCKECLNCAISECRYGYIFDLDLQIIDTQIDPRCPLPDYIEKESEEAR